MDLAIPLLQSASGTPHGDVGSTPISITLSSIVRPTITAIPSSMSSSTIVSAMMAATTIPTAAIGSGAAVWDATAYHYPRMDSQGIGLLILCLAATILCIPPLIWHIRSKNTGATCLVAWLIYMNLTNFVNVIIWPNDSIGTQWKGYGLCDIEAKLSVGSYVGLTGALAAIMRDLCQVMNTKRITLVPSRKQLWINRTITGTLCFGFPIVIMALHYIVQSQRYYVFTLSGCFAAIDSSWLAVVMVEMWPMLLAALDAYYAVLLCFRMHRYKSEFSRLLAISNTTKSRFLRLFILSSALILILFPLQIYFFIRNIEFGVTNFSWYYTHDNPAWGVVQLLPSFGIVIFDRWVQGGVGVLLFCFFGMGDDALKMYRLWLRRAGLGNVFPAVNSDGPINGWSFFNVGSWHSLNSKVQSALRRRSKSPADVEANAGSMQHTTQNTETPATNNDSFTPRSQKSFTDDDKDDELFRDVLISRHITEAQRKRTSKDTAPTSDVEKESTSGD